MLTTTNNNNRSAVTQYCCTFWLVIIFFLLLGVGFASAILGGQCVTRYNDINNQCDKKDSEKCEFYHCQNTTNPLPQCSEWCGVKCEQAKNVHEYCGSTHELMPLWTTMLILGIMAIVALVVVGLVLCLRSF